MTRCPPTCSSCESFSKSVFASLKPSSREFLESSLSHKIYKRGQAVFFQGNEPQGVYCIHQGKVKLYRQGISDRNTIVRIAGPGDLLGYRALFSGEEYTASAEAIEDASICFFEKRVLESLIRSDPNLAFTLLRKIGKDLRASEDRFQKQTEAQLRERVAGLIVMLKDQHGVTSHNGQNVLNIQLSRREIADMLGTTIESVIRQISQLKKEGLLEDLDHKICIRNEPALQNIAGLDI